MYEYSRTNIQPGNGNMYSRGRPYKYTNITPTRIYRRHYRKPHALLVASKIPVSSIIPDVEVPGFRQICSSGKPIWWRCLWLILSTTAILVCTYQCRERLNRYLSDPSEINTYYLENKTLVFPSMTLCPTDGGTELKDFPHLNAVLYRRRFGNGTVLSPIDLLKTENISITEMWDLAKIDVNWTQFYSMADPDDGFEQEVYQSVETSTIYGNCTTFLGRTVRRYGVQSDQTVFFHGENTALAFFKVQFHPLEETDLVRYVTFYNGIEYDYECPDIFLRATELIYRNTRKQPCTKDATSTNKCFVDCLEAAIYARVKKKCRLPYMQPSDIISPCTTVEEFTDVMYATLRVVKLFQKDNCDCIKTCREIIYSVDLVVMTFKPHDKSLIRLWVGFLDPRITIIEEVPSYSGFDLFSDLGGSIGLFLGISCLQVFEIISAFVSKTGKRCKTRKK